MRPIALLLLAILPACGGVDDVVPVDCMFEPQLAQGTAAELVQLAADDGSACVKLRRTPVQETGFICKACPYAVDELRIGVDGVVHVVVDPGRVYYDASHHNWADAVWANLDDGSTVQVELLYGTPWTYQLTRYTDAAVVGPVPLSPTAPFAP